MSLEKYQGGINLPNLALRNIAFGGKLVWSLYEKAEAKWCRIFQRKYLDSSDPSKIFTKDHLPKGSVVLNFLVESQDLVTRYLTWKINNSFKALFW